jgi:Xaa-Pro aminopeptidase
MNVEQLPGSPDLAACRARQRRLLDALASLDLELALLTRRESVQWLTGAHISPPYVPLAVLTSGGRVTLVLPERQLDLAAAADERIGYEAKWHSTNRDDQSLASAAALAAKLPPGPRRAGCEFSTFCPHRQLGWEAPTEIDQTLFQLRRRKDADELAMLQRANEANRAMFEHARRIIRPGVNELDVYSALSAVAVRTLGEPLTYFGQDFRSGARGGPPRNRGAEAGELYILDLGVGFRGYHSDNARTFAVDGEPSDEQQRAWRAVVDVLRYVESVARPGASCRAVFEAAQGTLDELSPWAFNHHLGHGVGLAPQEGPHLNPHWDDTFAEGDFFTVEPGLYHRDLRAGIRLEQNYLVTAGGVELLTDWPLGL